MFIKKLKGNIFFIFVLIATFLVIILMLLLNDVVIHIRFMELKAFLRVINREDSNVDYLWMVSKYKLYKELYNNRINEEKLDKEELKLEFLNVYQEETDQVDINKYQNIYQPVLALINGIRYLLNKPKIENYANDPTNNYLDIAYYYERNKNYQNALTIYDKARKDQSMTKDKIPIIILHEGFCHSIIGEYAKAREQYLAIINNYDNENIAITAAILLRYLDDFQSEIKRVKESNVSSEEKSEKLFKLIAYKDALEILDKISSTEAVQNEKLKFYKARCMEETGKKEEAVKIYQDIIVNDKTNKFAPLSNRRLVVIANNEPNETKEKLKTLIRKNNELINDPNLAEFIDLSNQYKLDEQNKTILDKKIDDPELTKTITQEKTRNLFTEKKIDDFILDSSKKIEKETKIKETKTIIKETKIQKPQEKLIKKVIYDNKDLNDQNKDQQNTNTKKKQSYTVTYSDKKGVIYRAERFDENNKLVNYFIYNYDEKGNPVSVEVFDGNGNPVDYY